MEFVTASETHTLRRVASFSFRPVSAHKALTASLTNDKLFKLLSIVNFTRLGFKTSFAHPDKAAMAAFSSVYI